MKIDGIPALLQLALQTTLAGKGDAFRPLPVDEAVPAARVPATIAQPTTSVQMLVALAAIDPVIERRRRQAEHPERGLTLLEQLDREVADGVSSPESLEALADWARNFTLPEDPDLATIAREVELRVRVELAKHDLTA